MNTSTDRIERQVLLQASRSRVWQALSNAEEFGNWFGVKLQGKSFAVGKHVQGNITYPGYEYIVFDIVIEKMEPENYLAWRWHPAPVERDTDYSKEARTLVEFRLQDVEGGTLLKIVESGFDQLSPARRAEAFRMNSGGWDEQLENITKHVAKT